MIDEIIVPGLGSVSICEIHLCKLYPQYLSNASKNAVELNVQGYETFE